jgi:hypothetical protein
MRRRNLSAIDTKRTSCRGANTGICIGLSIVVNRRRRATCSDAWKQSATLSISHDIIVKQHAGSIEVDTQLGEFTEIRVIFPRAAALLPGGS